MTTRAQAYVQVFLSVIIPEMIQQNNEEYLFDDFSATGKRIAAVLETTSAWVVNRSMVCATVAGTDEGDLWGYHLAYAWDKTYNAMSGSPWDMPLEQGHIDKTNRKNNVSTFEW
jgi:hypothetical protein